MSSAWFVCQEENLRTAIANCPTWLTITGLGDVEEAIEFVHIDLLERDDKTKEVMTPADMISKRPFAIVWTENPTISKIATDSGLSFGGEAQIAFEMATSTIATRSGETTEGAQLSWWKDKCGQLLAELFSDHYGYFQRTIEIAWRSYRAEDIEGDVAHMAFWCRFIMGYEE
jgi:hypothetical protein